MIDLVVRATTRQGSACEFVLERFGAPPSAGRTRAERGFRLEIAGAMPYRVTVAPPAGERLAGLSYLLTTPLRNFHQVIVPDTGRWYSTQTQLTGFWASRHASRMSNVRMPVTILTGMDLRTALAFGVIGENYETDFIVHEPTTNRALIAWMKRLTMEVRRGTEDYPIPESVAAARPDGAVAEHLYLTEAPDGEGGTWVETLRDFAGHMARIGGLEPRTTDDSLRPYWCSWTDWFSGDVTADVILANVREGVRLGIRNYIIDDGWFGPGLDSDYSVDLNIGDWEPDAGKIPDLAALVETIGAEGGNAVLWCAPHAVAPAARCFADRRRWLIQTAPGRYMMTSNRFHSLCFRCPEARQIMAGICEDLARRYGVAGAKYDLFNCVPDDPCVSTEHEHDTDSAIEGLARTLALIDRRTRSVRDDFLVELKQNYATPWLYGCGTVVRAGDTPYCPEGNFLRAAHVAAYTPFALNDYQSITNGDSPEAAACMIIKMLTVGVPAYSMDLVRLGDAHRAALRFFHDWHEANLSAFRAFRTPLDGRLASWRLPAPDKDIYFLLNDENRLHVDGSRPAEVLCGTFRRTIHLTFDRETSVHVAAGGPWGRKPFQSAAANVQELSIPARPGDIVRLRFGD